MLLAEKIIIYLSLSYLLFHRKSKGVNYMKMAVFLARIYPYPKSLEKRFLFKKVGVIWMEWLPIVLGAHTRRF